MIILNNSSFQLVRKISSKSSSKVFLVKDSTSCLKVCKFSKKGSNSDFFNQNPSEGFLKELSTIPLLSHKNIISVALSSADSVYMKSSSHSHACSAFITEYYPQGDILGLVYSCKNGLDERNGRAICKQVASGIEFMHSQGLAHCDIRLENLLITNDGIVKIIDFEFVQPCLVSSCEWVGSNYYRAPEVIRGESYLPEKTDVFAAGCTFFGIFFGCPAFFQASSDDRLYCELQERPDCFWRKLEARIEKNVGYEMKALLEGMMKDQQNDRLSMSEVLEDL